MAIRYDVVVKREARRGIRLEDLLETLSKKWNITGLDHQDTVLYMSEVNIDDALGAMAALEKIGAVASLVTHEASTSSGQPKEDHITAQEFASQSSVPESAIIEGIRSGDLRGYVEHGVFFLKLNEFGGAELANKKSSSTAGSAGAAAGPFRATQGLVRCEFCQGFIKPNVTYCKHCGIRVRC